MFTISTSFHIINKRQIKPILCQPELVGNASHLQHKGA